MGCGGIISAGWNRLGSLESAKFWLKFQPAGMRRIRMERQPKTTPTPLSRRGPSLVRTHADIQPSTTNSSQISADSSDFQLELSRFQPITAGWNPSSEIQPAGTRRSDSEDSSRLRLRRDESEGPTPRHRLELFSFHMTSTLSYSVTNGHFTCGMRSLELPSD